MHWKNHTNFFLIILKNSSNDDEQKKPEVKCSSRSLVLNYFRFLLWRHLRQKALFPICPPYKVLESRGSYVRSKTPFYLKFRPKTHYCICHREMMKKYKKIYILTIFWRHNDPKDKNDDKMSTPSNWYFIKSQTSEIRHTEQF